MSAGTSYRSVEVTRGGARLEIRRLPTRLRPDQLVVKTRLVGICRSDLKEVAGVRQGRSDFGHEVVGSVIASGADAPLGVGEQVCLNPNVAIRRSSGFAEYIVAEGRPGALKRAFPVVSRDVPEVPSAFSEPIACAHRCAARVAKVLDERLPGARVAVIGAGTAGTLIALLVRARGAAVTVVNRSSDRLHFLSERRFFGREDLRPLSECRPGSFDACVVATSIIDADVLAAAFNLVAPGGVMVPYGRPVGDSSHLGQIDLNRVRTEERVLRLRGSLPVTLVGSYGADEGDFDAASSFLTATAGQEPRVERLVQRFVTIDELPGALTYLSRNRAMGKWIVHPG